MGNTIRHGSHSNDRNHNLADRRAARRGKRFMQDQALTAAAESGNLESVGTRQRVRSKDGRVQAGHERRNQRGSVR